jgi:hypothetical protein
VEKGDFLLFQIKKNIRVGFNIVEISMKEVLKEQEQ